VLTTSRALTPCPNREAKPCALASYWYLRKSWPKLPEQSIGPFRTWVLDSGAFTAKSKGVVLDVEAYIDFCRMTMAADPATVPGPPHEIFALDVIGDGPASMKNYQRMRDAGVPAIPTFHVGEPQGMLLELARDYDKIALGGAVGFGRKVEWAKNCFDRVMPKKIHGLGFGIDRTVLPLPWHSTDAISWVIFGRHGRSYRLGSPGRQWARATYMQMPADQRRGVGARAITDIEVDYMLRLEHRHRQTWWRLWEQQGWTDDPQLGSIYFVV
jgi:hypothetical protein